MPNQRNQALIDRRITAGDVKSKIGNLITENRRREKEQGKTGASPYSWKYYDTIDKLIGILYTEKTEVSYRTFMVSRFFSYS